MAPIGWDFGKNSLMPPLGGAGARLFPAGVAPGIQRLRTRVSNVDSDASKPHIWVRNTVNSE